jgi:hypothetical protein
MLRECNKIIRKVFSQAGEKGFMVTETNYSICALVLKRGSWRFLTSPFIEKRDEKNAEKLLIILMEYINALLVIKKDYTRQLSTREYKEEII